MEKEEQKAYFETLDKCRYSKHCRMNLCPLDPELRLKQKAPDKCRWMRDRGAKSKSFVNNKGRKVIFNVLGGPQMPDELLQRVLMANIKWLNEPSRKRWEELTKLF